jgi:serine/threonine-protein kinase
MLTGHPTKGRTAKLVDFGLAKSVDVSMQLTQAGDMLGSPAYMSPEQCRVIDIDQRVDIYGLGALMYDVLVGRPPIIGATVYETLIMHTTVPPMPFPDDAAVPEWLQRIIFKCLEKDRANRQSDVDELLSEIHAGVTQALLSFPSDSKKTGSAVEQST